MMNIKRNNKTLIVAGIILIVVLLMLVYVIENNKLRKEQMIKDLEERRVSGLNDTNYTIKNIEIVKSENIEDLVHYYCKVDLDNEEYKVKASAELIYDVSERKNWNLIEVSDYSEIKYTALKGVTEDEVKKDLSRETAIKGNELKEYIVKEHNTNLKDGVDEYLIEYEAHYKMYDFFAESSIIYKFDENYGWKYWKNAIINRKIKLHPEGNWRYEYKYNNTDTYNALSFEGYTDSTISIGLWYVDTLHREYSVKYITYEYDPSDSNVLQFELFGISENGITIDSAEAYARRILKEEISDYKMEYSLYQPKYDNPPEDTVEVGEELIGQNIKKVRESLIERGLNVIVYGEADKITEVVLPGHHYLRSRRSNILTGSRMGNGSTVILYCVDGEYDSTWSVEERTDF